MAKMNDIYQQAQEKVDDEVGTSEVPDYVYREAIVDEARRILMEEKEGQDCNG